MGVHGATSLSRSLKLTREVLTDIFRDLKQAHIPFLADSILAKTTTDRHEDDAGGIFLPGDCLHGVA